MYKIEISGMPISKGELEEAILDNYPKTIEDAKQELLEAFRYLKAKFGSTFLKLKANELRFDCASAEIIEL